MKFKCKTTYRCMAATFVLAAFAFLIPQAAEAKKPAKSAKAKTEQKKPNTFASPDFAFPETVINNAETVLSSTASDTDVVKALVQITIASEIRSNASTSRLISQIDSVATARGGATAAILYSLEAQMLSQSFANNWGANSRELPLDQPFPDDLSQWSADMYRVRLLELCQKSLSNTRMLKASPIKNWQPLLSTLTEEQQALCPDLYVLLAMRSITMLDDVASRAIMPIPFFKSESKYLTPAQRCLATSTDLLTDLISYAYEIASPSLLAYTLPQAQYSDNKEAFDKIMEAYGKFSNREDALPLLIAAYDKIPGRFNDDAYFCDSRSQYMEAARQYLTAYPKAKDINALKNIITTLETEKVMVTTLDTYRNDMPVKIKILGASANNTLYIKVFRIKDWTGNLTPIKRVLSPSHSEPVRVAEIKVNSDFCKDDSTEITFDKLPFGDYMAVLAKNGGLDRSGILDTDYIKFNVTNMYSMSLTAPASSGKKEKGIYVVDNMNGAPIKDAKVTYEYTPKGQRNSVRKKISNITDTDGYSPFSPTASTYSTDFEICKGDDNVSGDLYIYGGYSGNNTSNRANIYTDLGLYHPGDSVRFAVVVYSIVKEKSEIVPSHPVIARLFNPSGVQVDSLKMTTDSFGRAEGSFKIPEGGMNGSFALNIEDLKKNGAIGWSSVEVADYVLPKFFVEAKPTAKSYKPGDTVKIEGQAQTYSGMPVAGADVDLTVSYSPLWRWRHNSSNDSKFTAKLSSDGEGKFSIELPTSNLPESYNFGVFTVTASATSPSGETRVSDPASFTLGAGSHLDLRTYGSLFCGKDSVRLEAWVMDVDRTPKTSLLNYSLVNIDDPKTSLHGEFLTPYLNISTAEIPSGTYRWEVSIPGTDIKESKTVIMFRDDDAVPPTKTALWMPGNYYVCKENKNEIEIPVGSSFPDSHILCIVSDANRVIEKRWINADAKNVKMKFAVPKGEGCIYVNFATLRDGKYYEKRIQIETAQFAAQLNTETVTFRDNITAGGRESWEFRYKLGENKVGVIPIMATMTDMALNSIKPFNWNKLVYSYMFENLEVELSGESISESNGVWTFSGKRLKESNRVVFPDINTYNMDLCGERYYDYVVVKECASECLDNEPPTQIRIRGTRNLAMKSAAPMAPAAGIAVSTEEESASADSDGGDENESQTENYRPSECPVAFFKPSLTTDSDGMLDLTFDAPDFNTTWQLQLLAYTPELKSVVQTLECTASKKVMVQAQLPQFLRTGDKTALRFTAFNNSGAKADITLTASVFNPYTGATICEKSFAPESTADKASFVKGLEFTAPSDLDMVGVKVMARIGESSDGEQSLIGILPSSTPVTESAPFYLAPDRMEYSMEIPHTAEAQTWLSYCDNPVWTCVTSLPDMTFPKDASILSLIRRFYGNSIAAGLSAKYPQIPQAIKLWKEENDSTLVSPLQRDNELKITDLDDTPWTLDAQAETQRMQRLATLLDTQKCAERTKDALDELLRRQNNQGGWSWCDGMRPSAYITGRVLLYFSMLRQMDFITLDKKADNAIRKAVAYTDSELYKDYIRSKKHFSTSQMLNYLYVRSGLGDINMSSDFASLKNLAINAIRKEWRGFGIYDAAVASILLKREGYPMEARGILESLRQKALSSQERGMWYDNLSSSWDGRNKLITTMQVLEAYSEVTPQAPAVDLLRQWLLIQRQTENWGTADEIAEVVYAILSSGSDWTQDFAPATFKLDGKPLQTSRRDALTGSFTMPLTQGGTLTISKSAGHQAWGGVLSRRIAPITDVKAYSASDISVSKRILIMKEDANGTTATELKEGDALHVGDKVRVELLLVSQRDMDYVTVIDGRSACLSPIEQLSGYVWQDGGGYYRDVRTDRTNIFFDFLKKGSTYATYDCYVTQEGRYTLGIAQTQCLYAPMQTAHSAGAIVPVDAK